MDLARDELGKILSEINPYAWSLEDKEGLEHHQYYFLDPNISSSSENTTTSLMRLLALHAPPAALNNFLDHANVHQQLLEVEDCVQHTIYNKLTNAGAKPPRIDDRNEHGVHALHVAVHRNSFHATDIVRILLQHAPHLASMPMTHSLSFPLHILAGHTITIPNNVFEILLQANPSAVLSEDLHGDTPLSLLWKNVLRFRWSRLWELYDQPPNEDDTDSMSWMTVISPEQFRKLSLMMLPNHLTWHSLCQTDRLPPLLIRLFVNEPYSIQGSLSSQDEYGCTPLHYACQSKRVNPIFVPPELLSRNGSLKSSTARLVFRACPEAACIPDASGRFPLHYAVANKSTTDDSLIRLLVEACPAALSVVDPETELYPIQQYAEAVRTTESLSLLYELLRYCPETLHFSKSL